MGGFLWSCDFNDLSVLAAEVKTPAIGMCERAQDPGLPFGRSGAPVRGVAVRSRSDYALSNTVAIP